MANNASTTRPSLKILQVNLNNSSAAMSLMEQTCEELGTDIALLQEPNKRMARNDKYLGDIAPNSAIYLPPKSRLQVDKKGSGAGYVWISSGGKTYMSCYISPNCAATEYEDYLTDVAREIRNRKEEIIIGGDFNAKSHLWHSRKTDARGEALGEMISSLNLVVLNIGNTPTLRRHNGATVIDVTLSTARIAGKVAKWSVDDSAENLSDHNNITYEILEAGILQPGIPPNKGWRLTDHGLRQVSELAKAWPSVRNSPNPNCDNLTAPIQGMCKRSFRKRKTNTGKRPVHWWCEEVAAARRQCVTARRLSQRCNKANPTDDVRKLEANSSYKALRKLLRIEIYKAKERAWNKLLAEIDTDRWGIGYKIISKKIRTARHCASPSETEKQIRVFFPERPILVWDEEPRRTSEPLFTTEEVTHAIRAAKTKKAPGPDGIPAEVVKSVAETNIDVLTTEYNRLWKAQTFPQTWKVAKLILIEKPGDKDIVSKKYRPICLLNCLGKVYERLLKVRLEEELKEKGGLYEHQYGFRSGRSTEDAIRQVLSIADAINKRSYPVRQLAILITLDVKNAFNSLRWEIVINELKERRVNADLTRTIQDYLKDRKAISDHGQEFRVTCGVPQGSVLGPTLWNVAYDKVLRTAMPKGTTLIAFADDLAVVVQAKNIESIRANAATAVRTLTDSLSAMGLELAEEKTEMVILAGRQKMASLQLPLGSKDITSQEQVRYLGVHIDKDAKMKHHVERVVEKAERQVAALSRLMPNIRGPKQNTRKIYASVVRSTILYAASTWRKALEIKKYDKMVDRVNRAVALRTIQAYRSASLEATLVLAGLPPMKLSAQERASVYDGENQTTARARTMALWQKRWDESKDSWTKTLIPKIAVWTNRKSEGMELNYHTTQVMTGHGVFNYYLHRIGKRNDPNCWYCKEQVDDAKHTTFVCQRWERQRILLACELGEDITPGSLVRKMTGSTGNWTAITDFITHIMKAKENHERSLEKEAHDEGNEGGDLAEEDEHTQ